MWLMVQERFDECDVDPNLRSIFIMGALILRHPHEVSGGVAGTVILTIRIKRRQLALAPIVTLSR
jgi:hypothetical protein